MRIGNYKFLPSLAPSVVVLFLFPALISLGIWQLARADEKREIEANIHLAELKEPIKLNNLNRIELKKLSGEAYRSATALGQYDIGHQFLYDNRTHKGKPGYHVLSAFRLGNQSAVLVNRGWIPFHGRRDNIQDISIDLKGGTKVVLKGQIKEPVRSIVLSHDEEVTGDFPQTIQSINLDDMGKKLGYTLLPIIIELDKSASNGFVREWQPYYGSIAKHTAYAMQWFAMAAVLLILFVKLSLKEKTKN